VPDIKPTTAVIVAALQRTRAMLEQGWCRGQARDGNKFCLVGALAEATCTENVAVPNLPGWKVWAAAKAALESQMPNSYPNLVGFNDFTNQDRVLQLIDDTIKAVTA
jgi:hypothetical protein